MRKLADPEFIKIVQKYDILCFHECWVKCPENIELKGYEKFHIARGRCNGGGLVLFYKKWLVNFIEIIKSEADSMIWFKIDKCILQNKKVSMFVLYMYLQTEMCFIENIA